ncbi:MAG: hypothetical protein V7K89_08320 [Nostoc sp.]|uniref:hypothetical protein n=1 Tax=Nostoc sp. TaxID=1180 RepID=UPI002FF7F5BD
MQDAIANAASDSVLVVDYEIAPFIVEPAINAACFATAASHVTVTRYGSQPAYPTRLEIDSMFQQLTPHYVL